MEPRGSVPHPPGPPGVPPDGILLARLRAGDAQAFETLVRENAGRLRAVARRLLRNDADADDAVQEAFVAAFKALDRFEGKSRLGTWLHRITVNCALMKIRSRPPEADEDISDLMPRFLANGAFEGDLAAWADSPETEAVRGSLQAKVRECIDRLPDNYRVPLLLRDIEELSNEEVAEQLGVNVNTAKVRIHRARQALRALIEPIVQSGA